MNSIGPLIFLSLAFGFTLAVRIVILIILRSGETSRTNRTVGPKPTVIPSDLFEPPTNTEEHQCQTSHPSGK